MLQPAASSTRNTKGVLNATSAHNNRRSASKSNIMSVEDSVTSLVDFDLSESKFTIAGLLQEKEPSPVE